MGIRVVPWTTNDPDKMRAVIRTGVDGLISDRGPTCSSRSSQKSAPPAPPTPICATSSSAPHRGGRGLRPENTLPSFESGLDQLATELETDDRRFHRRRGPSYGTTSSTTRKAAAMPTAPPYTLDNRTYLRDISSADARKTLHLRPSCTGPPSPTRRTTSHSPASPSHSPRKRAPWSPYAPTDAAQLFRFAAFYAEFYATRSRQIRTARRRACRKRAHRPLQS